MNFREFKSMLQILNKSNNEGHRLRMALYQQIKDTLTYTEMWELSHSHCKGHYKAHPLYTGLKLLYEEQNNDSEPKTKN